MPTGSTNPIPDTPKPVTPETGSTNKPPTVTAPPPAPEPKVAPPNPGIQVIKPAPGAAPKATVPQKKKGT